MLKYYVSKQPAIPTIKLSCNALNLLVAIKAPPVKEPKACPNKMDPVRIVLQKWVSESLFHPNFSLKHGYI